MTPEVWLIGLAGLVVMGAWVRYRAEGDPQMRVLWVTTVVAGFIVLLEAVAEPARRLSSALSDALFGTAIALTVSLIWYLAKAVRWARRTQPGIFERRAPSTARGSHKADR